MKFETSERVINPKVTINGVEKNATRQLINGGSDIPGMKWEALYSIRIMIQDF